MKTISNAIVLILLLMASLKSYGQFNLSGKIINYTGKEELKINVPLVFGFYKENSIPIPVTKDGTFNITLPISETKFANLIFQRKFFGLLLNPGKDLALTLNVKDTAMKLTIGSAIAENKIMQAVDIEEYPFFFAKDQSKLAKFSYSQLQDSVVKPYIAQRDEKLKKVKAAKISDKDKALIRTELISITYNYLSDVARTGYVEKSLINGLIIDIFDASNPKPPIFLAGPQFYGFIDNYIRYLETKAFVKIKEENIPSNKPIPYFGISLDSANIFVKKYSKPQWRLLGAIKNLPLTVVEEYAYQLIINAIQYKELKQATDLASTFRKQFPTSKHLTSITTQINSLKAILVQNEKNERIKIASNYEQINSIYDIIRPLKGKVIYLDVWGTWCGPCKEELKHIPELKAKFKEKDVAYVYLDLDDDNLDAQWKEFIKVNNMEGLHLRKSRQTIVPFWKELLANATDKAEYYPQYFIFDKEGKLVVSKAKRPSEKEELYAQIEQFLK